MSPKERSRVLASLPNEVTYAEMAPPEGDQHQDAKSWALDSLRRHFGQQRRRRIYVGSEVPVYYPDERRFAPDLMVVFDADTHQRGKWVVSAEGKGLDFVLEVHFGGKRKKDAVLNVERYARLRIPEYFIYDRARQELHGYRLPGPDASVYVPIQPVRGRLTSEQLGLEVCIEGIKLRFFQGDTPLPQSAELITQLEGLVTEQRQRTDEAVRARQVETRRSGQERRRREKAEQRLVDEMRQRKDEAHRRREESRRRREETQRRRDEARKREEAEQRVKKLEAELDRLKRQR